MAREWHELTRVTQGQPVTVERVRVVDEDIAIEGSFAPPRLASLSAEDQVFVMAFVRCHGSIKAMEEMFGISYPTVKNRLNRIARLLEPEFVETVTIPPHEEAIGGLERGEISVDETIRRLSE